MKTHIQKKKKKKRQSTSKLLKIFNEVLNLINSLEYMPLFLDTKYFPTHLSDLMLGNINK